MKGITDNNMEVTAKHNAKDYFAASGHIFKRMFSDSPSRYIFNILGGIYGFFCAMCAVLLFQFLEKYHGQYRSIIVFALASVILAFIIGIISKYIWQALSAIQMYRPDGYATAPNRFSIEDDAFVSSTRGSVSRTAWKDIESVEKTKDYIFIFIDRGLAMYITRRAFSDDTAFEAYFNELLRRRLG